MENVYAFYDYQAGENIPAYKLVKISDNGLLYATEWEEAMRTDFKGVIGATDKDVSKGEMFKPIVQGTIPLT